MKPIRNRPVYRWLDPSRPSRKPVIGMKELMETGAREPDPALYRFDVATCRWFLKEVER